MKVPEGYVAFIEELPGSNTQGETLEQARENLHEAVALVLDANRALTEQSLEGAAVVRGPSSFLWHEAGRSDPSSGALWLRISARGK